MKSYFKIALTTMALSVSLVSAVSAATVACVGVGQTISLTTTVASTCAAVAPLGADNISGNSGGSNPDPLFALLGPGLLLIDKNDDGTSGTNPLALTVANSTFNGSWSISALLAPLGMVYTDLVIAFKTGGNRKDVSIWAAFSLADGTLSGTWSTTGKNSLSHVNLYGKLVPATVPVPAAGLLLVGALGGLAALRRRRKAV